MYTGSSKREKLGEAGKRNGMRKRSNREENVKILEEDLMDKKMTIDESSHKRKAITNVENSHVARVIDKR